MLSKYTMKVDAAKIIRSESVGFSVPLNDAFGGKLRCRLVYPEAKITDAPGVVIVSGWTGSMDRGLLIADELASSGIPTLEAQYRVDGFELAKDFLSRIDPSRRWERLLRKVSDILPPTRGSFYEDAKAALSVLDEKCSELGLDVNGRRGIVGFSIGGYVASTFEDPHIMRRVAISPYVPRQDGHTPLSGTLYFVGDGDTIAYPQDHCLRLFAKSPGPAVMAVYEGGHTDLEYGRDRLDLQRAAAREISFWMVEGLRGEDATAFTKPGPFKRVEKKS